MKEDGFQICHAFEDLEYDRKLANLGLRVGPHYNDPTLFVTFKFCLHIQII